MTRRRRRRQSGQALVIIALAGIVLFGFAAIALDLGIGMADRRDLQAEADSAALAGARQWSQTQDTNAEHWVASQYLGRNLGFSVPVNGSSCSSSTSCPAGTYSVGSYTFTFTDQGNGTFDLSLHHTRLTLLAGVLGFTNAASGSGARAQAGLPAQKCVVCILAKTGTSLTIESSGTGIQVPDPTGAGYGVQVNSNSCPSNTFNGNSTPIIAPGANFVGCALPSNNYFLPTPPNPPNTPFTPVNNAAPVPDPLGSVPEPAFNCCVHRGGTVLSDSGPVTLQPGIYSELHPTGSNITLQPGLYILTGDGSDPGDGILEDSNGTLVGTGGVTLFFTCPSFKSGTPKYCGSGEDPGANDCASPSNGATIVMSSNGNVGITAPSSGTYQGIAIFFDRCNSATIQMTANGSQSLTGAFYAKASQAQLTSSTSQVVVNGPFIAKTVDLQSNAGIKVNYDPSNPAASNPLLFSGSGWQPSQASLVR